MIIDDINDFLKKLRENKNNTRELECKKREITFAFRETLKNDNIQNILKINS